MKVGVIVAVVVVAIVALTITFMGIGYRNHEVELRNQAEAQEDANQVIYDKTWKVVKQKAQIADKYETAFKDIYSGLMSARYSADGENNPAFKWIHEQNPTLSTELYKELGDSISGLRAEFAMVQNRLIDIKREHDNLRQRFPSSVFVGSRPELEINIVTSTKTEKTFAEGKEDDVDLF